MVPKRFLTWITV